MNYLKLCIVFLFFWSVNAEEQIGIASQFMKDQGINKHESVLLATSFEDGIKVPLKIHRKGVELLKDEEIAHNGQHAVKITATKNVDQGGDVKYKWDKGVETCYMRVYVRFDKDTLMPHHFIGMGGHTPTYKYRWGGSAGLRPPGGKDGKFAATLEPPKGANGGWKFYTYWHEMHSWQTVHGEADGRPNAFYGNNFRPEKQPHFKRDEWICVELMIKLNTPGKHDGEQAFWINGEKVGHWKAGSPEGTWIRDSFRSFGKWNKDPKPFEGFNWRTDEALKINYIYLQWYLSKNQSWPKMTADKNTVYFDDLVLATEYIGPMKKE